MTLNRCFSNLIDSLQRHRPLDIVAAVGNTDLRLLIPVHSFSLLAIGVFHYSYLVPHFGNLIADILVVVLDFDPLLGNIVDSWPSTALQK